MYPLRDLPLEIVFPRIKFLCCGCGCLRSTRMKRLRERVTDCFSSHILSSSSHREDCIYEEKNAQLDKIIKRCDQKPYEGTGKKHSHAVKFNDEVFDAYGIGIASFFTLLRTLIVAFFMMSIMVLPIMYCYTTKYNEVS